MKPVLPISFASARASAVALALAFSSPPFVLHADALAGAAAPSTTAATPTAPAASAATPISPLPSPAAADSGESNLFSAPDGAVYLTWCGPSDTPGERALRFATLPAGADTWSAPRTIVSTPLLMENWADFPTLTVDARGTITAQWFQSAAPRSHSYSGWSARSTDSGVTWTPAQPLGEEFVSLATLADGRVLAVWLAHVPAPTTPRVPGAPTMKLCSRLLSPTGEILREDTIDPDVCSCCQTTLALLPGDEVLVAYRGHTSQEIRDNSTARFHPDRGWSQPALIHADGWKIAACPVNGPALDARGNDVAITWFTAAGDHARVQARRSTDAGRTWGAVTFVDVGRPLGRLDLVMLRDGTALVSWLDTLTEKSAGLYVRRIFADGATSAPLLIVETATARASGLARMALRPDGTVVLAYTEATSPSQVRTLSLDAARLTAATTVRAKTAGLIPPAALEICAAPLHPSSNTR